MSNYYQLDLSFGHSFVDLLMFNRYFALKESLYCLPVVFPVSVKLTFGFILTPKKGRRRNGFLELSSEKRH